MEFIKKNYLIIIFFILIAVIIGLTVKCINSNPVSITPPNNFYDYATEKMRQDSITIEALEFSHFKSLNEAKHSRQVSDSLQRQLLKLKQKTNEKQKDVSNLTVSAGDSLFNEWTNEPPIQW